LLALTKAEATSAMRAFRILSPLGWVGALVFFFFPWMEIRCPARKRWPASTITVSGSEIVRGGETSDNPRIILGRGLLGMYALGLFVGPLLFWARPAGVRRALAGIFTTLGMFVCLLGSTLLIFSDSTGREPPFTLLKDMLREGCFTRWYFGSYLANLVVLFAFQTEWVVSRRGRVVEPP
jgi:hypothetical protein